MVYQVDKHVVMNYMEMIYIETDQNWPLLTI